MDCQWLLGIEWVNLIFVLFHEQLSFLIFRFELNVKFSIPNIVVEPTLDVIQKAITDAANGILETSKGMVVL